MYGNAFFHIAAQALVPEQLTHYVRAVSGRSPVAAGEHVAYLHERHAVLVAYPENSPENSPENRPEKRPDNRLGGRPNSKPDNKPNNKPANKPDNSPDNNGDNREDAAERCPPVSLAPSLEVLRPLCDSVTVLAPFRPLEAPADAVSGNDLYWQIGLPAAAPGQKLRNMLRRAGREAEVAQEFWGDEHAALVRQYLDSRPLAPGTRAVFGALAGYAGGGDENVVLFAARRADGRLAAFLVGDFTSLHTAFYMFAFRAQDAPPGCADLLLGRCIGAAEERGHSRVNLGLGINPGIAFFKKKWGAAPFLPYVETSWSFAAEKTSILSSLRSLFTRK